MSSIQDIVEEYPLLFIAPEFRQEAIESKNEKEVAKMFIECGDGWQNIIRCFCSVFYNRLNHAIYQLERCHPASYQDAKQNVDDVIFELPYISQIKEKWGRLCMYIDSTSPDSDYDLTYDLITFAENMSEHTCEVCGSPGTLTSGNGWLQTLCPTHATERGAKPCKQ